MRIEGIARKKIERIHQKDENRRNCEKEDREDTSKR